MPVNTARVLKYVSPFATLCMKELKVYLVAFMTILRCKIHFQENLDYYDAITKKLPFSLLHC